MIAHVADEDVTNNSRNKQAHINYIIIYILHIERDREIGIERERRKEREGERETQCETPNTLCLFRCMSHRLAKQLTHCFFIATLIDLYIERLND